MDDIIDIGVDFNELTLLRELVESNSEFSEGTLTKLTEEEMRQFIPFAQNAQSVLKKAIRDIEDMRVEDQVKHLDKVIRSVVRSSSQKNYQMFMRYAFNRTLLLVKELNVNADVKVPGILENALDL